MQLKGKRIFITGGTGGMGVPLVACLQSEGAEVTVYSRAASGDLVENIATTCEQLAANTPDILINMAGFNMLAYCEDQLVDVLVTLNLIVPMKLTQAVLPAMKARGAGQIVNIGSMTGLIPLPHLTGYVAAKAGLRAFSDALRRELDGSGVSVTHIAPRAVATNANKGIKAVLNKRTGVKHDNPDVVAKRIVLAIIRREADVRMGFPERIFALIQALFPKIIDMGLRKNRRIGEELLNQPENSPQKILLQSKEIENETSSVAAIRAAC